jgi:hypothetical protein
MQGAGKAKEAGAWGHPFWTMLQGLCLTVPLGGCLLTGAKPEPGLDIPAAYSAGPRNPVAGKRPFRLSTGGARSVRAS